MPLPLLSLVSLRSCDRIDFWTNENAWNAAEHFQKSLVFGVQKILGLIRRREREVELTHPQVSFLQLCHPSDFRPSRGIEAIGEFLNGNSSSTCRMMISMNLDGSERAGL
jgi:hypothetical protein